MVTSHSIPFVFWPFLSSVPPRWRSETGFPPKIFVRVSPSALGLRMVRWKSDSENKSGPMRFAAATRCAGTRTAPARHRPGARSARRTRCLPIVSRSITGATKGDGLNVSDTGFRTDLSSGTSAPIGWSQSPQIGRGERGRQPFGGFFRARPSGAVVAHDTAAHRTATWPM